MAVDADTPSELPQAAGLGSSERRGFLCGGNFIVDTVKLIDAWPEQDTVCTVLAAERSNGGGPYNVLKDLSRIDPSLPLSACGLVGDDAEGRWIREDCRKADIGVRQLRVRDDAETSVTDVMSVAGSSRRTFFHQPGANALVDVADFDFAGSNAKVFLLGYLLLLPALDADGGRGAAEVLRRAREAGMLAAVDCVSVPDCRFREVARAGLAEADWFLTNEIESGWILGREVTLDEAPAAARELAALGRASVVLHLPEAAIACPAGGSEVIIQPAVDLPPERIAGTTGAGDAFAAGFLHGLHEERGILECLQRGACVAAMSLTDPTPSDGIRSLDECLAFGRARGFRSLA